nr:calcium-binding protein [uncultured Cohaesibacter sp.]
MAQGSIYSANTGVSQWLDVFDPSLVALVATSSKIVLENYDGSLTILKGAGFSYNASDQVTGGTLTSIEYTNASETVIYAEIDGFSLPHVQWSHVTYLEDLFAIILSGNDTMSILASGTEDDEMLLGGYDGDDNLTGGAGVDQIWGDNGDDTINAGAGDDMLYGGRGDDYINGGAGHDNLYYQNDHNEGGTGAITVDMRSGTVIDGFGDTDTVVGIESFRGTMHNDTFIGSDQSYARYQGVAGNDVFIGGSGYDAIDYRKDAITVNSAGNYGRSGVTVNLISGTAIDGYGDRDTLSSIEEVRGSDYSDTLIGSAADERLRGEGGADILRGNGGSDRLEGGNGNDKLYGGAGLDIMLGGQGNDSYYVNAYGDKITESAGQGIDIVFSSSNYNLKANSQYIENITLTGSANLNSTGNMQDNRMVGNAGENVLRGLVGNDTLIGKASDDTLRGDIGNDILRGDNGNDTLIGNQGNDKLYGGAGLDTMSGNLGNDTYYVDAYGDKINEAAGQGIDKVFSSSNYNLKANSQHIENITLTGKEDLNSTGNMQGNIMNGNAGDNTLRGLAGNDKLNGGAGNDTLFGGVGADRLNGGLGADKMYAGVDNATDTFVFTNINQSVIGANHDRIYQFEILEDQIDLSAIDGNSATDENDSLIFHGSSAMANSVWFIEGTTNTFVYADVDGDAVADFEIELVGSNVMSGVDLVL